MDRPHKTPLRLTTKKDLHGYVFILPFLIGLAAISLPCIVQSLMYAFEDVQLSFELVSRTGAGWANFRYAFGSDTVYRTVLLETVRGMLIDTVIILSFSFFISTLLVQEFRGRALARTLFFLPVILSTGIIAAADVTAAGFAGGAADNAGTAIGSAFGSELSSFFDLQELLMSLDVPRSLSETVAYAVDSTYTVVNRSGVQILIFLSALNGISPSIFEASRVEGATRWEEFWKITFPMITPMILVNFVYTIVDTFTYPGYGMLAYIQTQAFSLNRMGYASALSWIYFAIVFVLLGIVYGVLKRRIVYLDQGG